jgi:methionyl-tRNA formyltransferase
MSPADVVPRSVEASGPVAAVFFGSGQFAVPILETLAAMQEVHLVGVVSVADRPAGRGGRLTAPPIASLARERALPLRQPARLKDAASIAAIAELGPGLAILADYGRLVPPEVLALPRRGFLNLHPSLLPRHRGATPIQATILEGDERTGVTLFEMDAGLDTGPIVDQVVWPLSGRETGPELEAEAARRAAALLAVSLGPWLGGERPAHPQPASGVTTTRPLTRDDGRLDPHRPAAQLERQVRALTPWPGTFVDTAAGRVAVLRAEVATSLPGDLPGALEPDHGGLALTTAAGRLRLLEVRPAGGRAMSAADLKNGRPAIVGAPVIVAAPVDPGVPA